MIWQKEITLSHYSKGFHLITEEILTQLPELPESGLLNIFIQHTSAALTINENADPSVRIDLENTFNRLIKEKEPFYTHTMEGNDDMPAHIKSSIIGASLIIPITKGKLALGIWQGIYLCEFRYSSYKRKLFLTIFS